MDKIRKKLHDLEKNVISEIPNFEESFLLVNNDAEQQLYERARAIVKDHQAHLEAVQQALESGSEINLVDLSPDEQTIVFKSSSLITQRVMHLFDVTVGSSIHLNNPFSKWIFYCRLGWFLKEMADWLFLVWKEDQIISAPDFFTLCAGEQERRFKPIYDEWRDWLSKESWKKYYAEHKPKLRNYEDLTPEEIANLELDAENEEKEETEWIEREKRFLRDKCPDCTMKCRWYHEQTSVAG